MTKPKFKIGDLIEITALSQMGYALILRHDHSEFYDAWMCWSDGVWFIGTHRWFGEECLLSSIDNTLLV